MTVHPFYFLFFIQAGVDQNCPNPNPNPLRLLTTRHHQHHQHHQEVASAASSVGRLSVIFDLRVGSAYLLKVHVSETWHSAAHAPRHSAGHAWNSAPHVHAAEIHFVVHSSGRAGFLLLILIHPLGKVGLDVRILTLFFGETRPVLLFDVLFTKLEHHRARSQALFSFLWVKVVCERMSSDTHQNKYLGYDLLKEIDFKLVLSFRYPCSERNS